MKRPLAYVTAAWRGGECEVMEQAAKYCRIVYDAGYSPICPMLYLPLFLNDAVPEEHKNGIDFYDCYRSNMNHVDLEGNEAKVKRPGILIGSLSSLSFSSI